MKASTTRNYQQRLTQVIDYIYRNLDGDLSVNTLADVALMSPYHFHRIYREMARENLNATIRRLRLQRAAVELIRSTQPIARIAKQVSYGSQEAFSRAFSQQFGESPAEYRQNRLVQPITPPEPFIAMLPTQHTEYTDMFDVEINEIAPIQLLGYRHQGDYNEIGALYEKLFISAGSTGLVDQNTRIIGLYYDDPATVDRDKLRSVAGISVTDNSNNAGSDLEAITIPGGKAASIEFKGSYAETHKAYSWFFGSWLPQSGYDAADFPPFEEYLNDPKKTPPSELMTRISCLLQA
ncbi:MAG: AraC family transcriptional regulator [Thiolinea sp.]